MFRPVLLWPSSGWIQFYQRSYIGNEISFTRSRCACVQMLKNRAYSMCYPVCVWQCSVRAESVHAPCGAVGHSESHSSRPVWHSAPTTGKKILHRRTKHRSRPTAPHGTWTDSARTLHSHRQTGKHMLYAWFFNICTHAHRHCVNEISSAYLHRY